VVTPTISIVIPTRNRPDTLEVCLRALSRHTSPRIEIVVQDNSTSPATQELVTVASKTDVRIRYSQAPYPTSQRHNFELGLAAATGEYLTIIGDDDGFTLGSLDWLVDRLQRQPVDAVRWNLLHYVWPSLSEDGEGFMDLYHSMAQGTWSIEPAAALAARVIRAETQGSWDNLLVYHGMISRRVYDKMRAVTNGVFFPYPMPDVYAHNIIPFFCDRYLQVNDIVSIYGVSGHSAGASWTQARSQTGGASKEGNRWMLESVADEVAQKLPWQPDIRTLRYHDYAAFKLAQSYDMLQGYVLDDDLWAKAIVAELKMNATQIAPWFSIEPKASFDARVIEAVRSAFPNSAHAPANPSNKKRADNRIPSLRVKAVNPDLADDIDGAMRALGVLVGSTTDRFSTAMAPPEKRMRSFVRDVAHRAQRMAPNLSSRVFSSQYMPKPVWRYLKNLRHAQGAAGDTTRNTYEIHASIIEMSNRHAAKSTEMAEPASSQTDRHSKS
jgi:hypothetical protein